MCRDTDSPIAGTGGSPGEVDVAAGETSEPVCRAMAALTQRLHALGRAHRHGLGTPGIVRSSVLLT
jgi:hypothetical protein